MSATQETLLPPVPRPTPTSTPFWEGLEQGEVRLQQCSTCGKWVFYPRSRCPHCMADALQWRVVSGEGQVYTWTRCDRPTAPHFVGQEPMWIAVVELDEGVRMTTGLVDVDPEKVRVGMRVRPVFDPVEDDRRRATLLRFAPA